MSAIGLLRSAQAAGIKLSLKGDRVRVQAGREPPADLLEELRAHKDELLALLRETAGAGVDHPQSLIWLCETACRGLQLDPAELASGLLPDDAEALITGEEGPEALRAYAAAVAERQLRERGEVPGHYTAHTVCRGCGIVPIFEGAPAHVDGCPWCWNRIKGLPIPQAAL